MPAVLLPNGKQAFFTTPGVPAVGYKLMTWAAGTTTPQTTWADALKVAANANPIVLDARGEAVIFWDGAYKIQLQDSTGAPVWPPIDNVQSSPAPSGSLIPTVDNSFTVGSPAFSWANVYVGVNHAPVLDTVSGNIGYYKQTPAEIAAGVVPTNLYYPPGCPRRFGAVGNGIANDTVAVQNAINSCALYWGWPGDNYGVTTVIWPASGGPSAVHFNGSELTGIATVATTCISQIKSNFTNFYDYLVNGGSYLGVAPNSNYICGTWWFNGHLTASPTGTPDGASQFNNFFGCYHLGLVRGLVYGQLPGSASSSTITHSENRIYGWQTVGVSNPFYCNSSTGFIHFYGATFFRDASTWTTPTLPSTARAYEQVVGNLYIHGGEIIASNSLVGFAADGQPIVDGAYIELSASLHITGDNARFIGCRMQVLNFGVSLFKIDAAATGVLAVANSTLFRPAGSGATDRTPLVDGSAAPTFEVDFNNTTSFEWGFVMAGANVKLIQGCIARYSNHRLSITAADANVYLLNTPKVSLLPEANSATPGAAGAIDHLGYTTFGWTIETLSGAGATLTNTTNAGPPGYLASQLTLHATNQSRAWCADPTSLTTLKAGALRVTPGEAYWLSSWMKSNGGTVQLLASFYTLAGAAVSTVLAADTTSVGSAAWVFAEGPIVVPATAAYMLVGTQGIVSDVQFTDLRLQRAN